MEIEFNEERALAVFRILDKEWRAKRGIFENIVLPQDRLKLPNGKREMINFLFYSALFMRGGVISEDPFRWLVALYERRPKYYDPAFIVKKKLTTEHLKKAFLEITQPNPATGQSYSWAKTNGNGQAFAYKIDEYVKAWIHNSHLFVNKFDGNILGIFDGVTDFEEAFARIDRKNKWKQDGHGIMGMRRKIFSLFTIWLQEKKLIPVFPTPIPVDFHALRVLWVTGVLQLIDLPPFSTKDRHPESYKGKTALQTRENLIDTVTKWSQIFLARIGISHLVINPALWTLSRDLCANHFQNIVPDRGEKIKEPADLVSGKIRWPTKYKNPCFVCPIESYCSSVVPAAPYYVWGILMRMERIPYYSGLIREQTTLPGMEEAEALSRLQKIRRRTKK